MKVWIKKNNLGIVWVLNELGPLGFPPNKQSHKPCPPVSSFSPPDN